MHLSCTKFAITPQREIICIYKKNMSQKCKNGHNFNLWMYELMENAILTL